MSLKFPKESLEKFFYITVELNLIVINAQLYFGLDMRKVFLEKFKSPHVL